MIWNVLVFSILCASVCALTDEELKVEFTKYVMKCTKDHPVDMNELLLLQKMVVPKKRDVKCLLACAYKLEGAMDAKGFYDLEHGYKIAEIASNGEEKRLVNGKKLADMCSKVNEAEVSDGEKGYDRAALMFKCVADNSPKVFPPLGNNNIILLEKKRQQIHEQFFGQLLTGNSCRSLDLKCDQLFDIWPNSNAPQLQCHGRYF